MSTNLQKREGSCKPNAARSGGESPKNLFGEAVPAPEKPRRSAGASGGGSAEDAAGVLASLLDGEADSHYKDAVRASARSGGDEEARGLLAGVYASALEEGRTAGAPAVQTGEAFRPGSRQHGKNLSNGPGGSRESAENEPEKSSSALLDGDEKREKRWELRRGLWEITKKKSCAGCGRWPTGEENISIQKGNFQAGHDESTERTERAFVSGVQTCSNVWVCPCCSAKIRQERANVVSRVVANHLGGKLETRGGAGFQTLTLPHDQGDDLAALCDAVKDAWQYVNSGGAAQKLKEDFGLVGYVSALEITVGPNGWHPHLHIIFLFEKKLPHHRMRRLNQLIYDRWAKGVEREGYRRPRYELCPLEPVYRPSDASAYVTGVDVKTEKEGRARSAGAELTRFDEKEARSGPAREEHLTPFQLLGKVVRLKRRKERAEKSAEIEWTEEEEEHLKTGFALWYEWEKEMKGRHMIRWGGSAKDGKAKAEDEAEERAEGDELEEVLIFSRDAWYACVDSAAIPDLLDMVEAGQHEAARSLVRRLYRARCIEWHKNGGGHA